MFRIGAFLVAIAMLGASAPVAPRDAESIAREATKELAQQRAGVTAFRMRYFFQEHGPGHNKTSLVESMRLRDNGRLIAVRLLHEEQDGNTVSAADLAKDQAKVDEQLPGDDYILPISAASLEQYKFAYSKDRCSDCAEGIVKIDFTSLKRDSDHGDGFAVIDSGFGFIQRLEFHPSELPAHADSGTIVMQFGQVLPDLWDVVETTQHFTGHMLMFSGWGNVTQTYTAYRRFGSVAEGKKALASATL